LQQLVISTVVIIAALSMVIGTVVIIAALYMAIGTVVIIAALYMAIGTVVIIAALYMAIGIVVIIACRIFLRTKNGEQKICRENSNTHFSSESRAIYMIMWKI
jgi:hypothetical protein